MSFSKPPLGPARTDQAIKSSRRHALLREDFQKQYWPVALARAVYEHYEQLQDDPMAETKLIVILTVRGIETLPGEWRDVTRKEVVDYLMTSMSFGRLPLIEHLSDLGHTDAVTSDPYDPCKDGPYNHQFRITFDLTT